MLSLTVIPAAPVTNQIIGDLRGAFYHREGKTPREVELCLCINNREVARQRQRLEPGRNMAVRHRFATTGYVGNNRIDLEAWENGKCVEQCTEFLQVIPAAGRSPGRLAGAWNGLCHWSDEEGRHWNNDIRRMTDADWRAQVRDMSTIGLQIMVIQETFRNQMYYGEHEIEKNGYRGLAYYPSALFAGRMELPGCCDPLEAILDEADQVGMRVFPGVGLYAWFDYSTGSLAWHKLVAEELFRRYGHHRSFYGFYVSEEIGGDLGTRERAYSPPEEVIGFFREFQEFCRAMAPDKPVMLAPNAWGVPGARTQWRELLRYLDILCPFAFHRMPDGDVSGEEAAALLQELADEAGVHLWLDMELFLFDDTKALYPRPIDGLLEDMRRFDHFETILGYQYAGLLNAPGSRIRLGGERAERLYLDYQRFRRHLDMPQ